MPGSISASHRSRVCPTTAWRRSGHISAEIVFRHGAQLYNFPGLRAYKEKFEPSWEPAYLIYPRRSLAFVITDIATLIGGGWTGLVRR